MDQEEAAQEFEQYDLLSAAVVDENERLVGVLTIDDVVDVIQQEAETSREHETRHAIPATMDQEEAAREFEQYNLLSAAVVDENGRLVGVLTIDDVVDVIQEEAEEDLLRMGCRRCSR